MCPLCIAMNFLLRHLCVSWWNYSGTVCLLEYSSWTNCSAWNIWWSSTSPCIQVPVKTVEVMNRCSKNGKSAYSLLTANMLMCIVNIKVNCQKIVLWNSSPQDEASSYFPCTTSSRSPSLSYWTSTKSILSVLMMLQKKLILKFAPTGAPYVPYNTTCPQLMFAFLPCPMLQSDKSHFNLLLWRQCNLKQHTTHPTNKH